MLRLLPWIVVLSSLAGLEARAEPACASVDQRAALGPVWEQKGDAGWCASYTASDLLSFRLKRQVSPVALALDFYDGDYTQGGGSPRAVIKKGIEKGLCLEERMRSRGYRVQDTFRQFNCKDCLAIVGEQPLEKMVRRVFPQLDALDQVVQSGRLLDRVRAQECKADTVAVPADLQVVHRDFSRSGGAAGEAAFLAELDLELDRGNIVAISYDSTRIMHPRLRRGGGFHVSSIVGRKLDPATRRCMYLIRNSWGTHAGLFDPAFKLEQGNVWVDLEFLKENLFGMDYIPAVRLK